MSDSGLGLGEEGVGTALKFGVATANLDQGGLLHAGLDALLIALHVAADDLVPRRRGAGAPPRIRDAELIALTVAQVRSDCPSERRFLRFAKQRAPQICRLVNVLANMSPSFCERQHLLDSAPVTWPASRETVKRSQLAGHAAYGWCAGIPARSAGSPLCALHSRRDAARFLLGASEQALARTRRLAARAYPRGRRSGHRRRSDSPPGTRADRRVARRPVRASRPP